MQAERGGWADNTYSGGGGGGIAVESITAGRLFLNRQGSSRVYHSWEIVLKSSGQQCLLQVSVSFGGHL